MDAFPASEVDELVTKHFLRAELADLRIEMHRLAMRQMGLLGGATALLATLGFFT